MNEFLQTFFESLGAQLPALLAAIGILIGGWILALIAAAIVRGLLNRVKADERLAGILGAGEDEGTPFPLSRWTGRLVFYLVLLFAVIGFLQALNLTTVAQPIQVFLSQILAFLPQALGAAVLVLLAWVVATAIRFVLTRLLRAARFDERLSTQGDVAPADAESVTATLGNVAYWLVLLLFLPAVLGALGLQGLLEPVQGVVDQILGVLPNLLGAALILFFGWLGARILRRIVTQLLAGIGLDRLADQAGLATALGQQQLSSILGTVVYVLILIPVAIGAVNALQIPALSEPAAQMLTTILNALPTLFGAILVLGIAFLLARVISGFITNVLTGVGFNRVLTWLGLEEPDVTAEQTPSQIAGYLATVAIMLLALIEAAQLLGFTIVAQLVSDFLVASGGVLLGLVIFGLGLYLAGLAERVIRGTTGRQASILVPIARVAILVFAGALALRQTGIAQDIVNLAFGLVIGAVAVAAALAFGLGARDLAARELERWIEASRNRAKPSA